MEAVAFLDVELKAVALLAGRDPMRCSGILSHCNPGKFNCTH